MPNHVLNKLTFTGSPDVLARLKETVKTEDSLFSFNQIIPMPESLNNDGSGGWEQEIAEAIVLGRFYKAVNPYSYSSLADVLKEKMEEVEKFQDKADKKKVETLVQNFYSYEFFDWYEWRVKTWGTKWDAYNISPEWYGDDNCIHIDFSTAWSVPNAILIELSRMFPEVNIQNAYADEDWGSNCGTAVYSGGERVSFVEGDRDFAKDLWGGEDKEEDAE